MDTPIPPAIRPTIALAVLALCLIATACGAPATTAPPEDAPVAHGVSTDPIAATGFITANLAPPETATERNGVMRDGDGRPYTYDLLGQKLPEISGPLLSGETFSTADIAKWTVIDVWGVWCGDCRKDGPYTADLAATLANDPDVDFISVHTPSSAARAADAYGTFGSVEAYFETQGYSYPTLIDADASIRDALDIAWTPSYLLVAPDGTIRGFRTDLSVANGDDPVTDFLVDIARVRAQVD